MSSIPSKGVGDALFSPEYNQSDMAQELAHISAKLDRQEQKSLLTQLSGEQVSEQHLPHVFGRNGKSAIRAHQYNDHRVHVRHRVRILDEAVNKEGLKCDAGHKPVYDKNSIPLFGEYGDEPAAACSNNASNVYLTWDDSKYKYCCASEPDSNEVIMNHSKNNIIRMLQSVAINEKSLEDLEYAIDKYLVYYHRVNPGGYDVEKAHMDKIKGAFLVKLTSGREKKSLRLERERPLTAVEANALWETFGSSGGTKRKGRRINRTKKTKQSRLVKRR